MASPNADRLERYDVEVARAMPGWRWEPVVQALMALRGFALLHAATLIAEWRLQPLQSSRPVDEPIWAWFPARTPPAINAARRHHQNRQRHRPPRPRRSRLRRLSFPCAGESPPEETPGRSAQSRHRHRLGSPAPFTATSISPGWAKKAQVAVTAVARELAGFVWAIARQIQPRQTGKQV